MRIVVVGLGYVGVTAAACLASQGHSVIGVDVNPQKAAAINAGEAPIVEPGVAELIAGAAAEGRLVAVTELPALRDADVVIVCVGTPSAADGGHNMTFIAEASRQIALRVADSGGRVTVAFRSTFKPGTMDELIAPIFVDALGEEASDRVDLVYNPEFLRESTAVNDYFNPPKIVLGTKDGRRSDAMAQLNDGIAAPVFETGFREAEITKFIDNSWHAVKVAFANEVGRISAAYGVDSSVAHSIFVSDTKLNISPYYTRPGGAFGGSCLPKDVRAMQHIAQSAGVKVELIDSLLDTNESHKSFQLERVLSAASPGARILVVGLAFKAGTDDMRESPNLDLVTALTRSSYAVRVYDPSVITSALVGQNLGHVMSELPQLRQLLISREDLVSDEFDLIVINSPALVDFPLDETAQVLDLSRI